MRSPRHWIGCLAVLALLLAASAAAQNDSVDTSKHFKPPASKRSVCIIGAGDSFVQHLQHRHSC